MRFIFLRNFFFCCLFVTACSFSQTDITSQQQADAAFEQLQHYYNPNGGAYQMWNGLLFWQQGNAVEALANYLGYRHDPQVTEKVTAILNQIHQEDSTQAIIGGGYRGNYDDVEWWGLAWLRAFQVTHNHAYLDESQAIYNYILNNAWGTNQCNGGLWWNDSRGYKNAITNELFLVLAMKLYQVTHQSNYLNMAKREWHWFKHSGMINSESLINDGLDSSCQNNHETIWSYNQGVILGGLAALFQLNKQATLEKQVQLLADQTLSHLTELGVLTESCEASTTGCDGDQKIFKGIWMRYFGYLNRQPKLSRPAYKLFIHEIAQHIWLHGQTTDGAFTQSWDGGHSQNPIITAQAQLQALDAFNSSMSVAQ